MRRLTGLAVLGSVLGFVGEVGTMDTGSPADALAAKKQELPGAYGKLPLAFVPNAGQTDARVRFSAQHGGAIFYFTQEQAVFAFSKGETEGVALRLAFLGGNPATTIAGKGLAEGKVNYLIGNDPSQWRTGLPTYGEVVYRDLWPGVDMVFRGDGSRLKYEFVLRPGARVEDIRLAYRGAEGLAVDRDGRLLIQTSMGTLTDTRPVSYQDVEGRRVPVESRFLLHPDSRNAAAYGFAVATYDIQHPLVIDPGLLYSTYLGGTGDDRAFSLAVDAAGSAYVTGWTASSNFPTTPGAFDPSLSGGLDAFVTKLNATGTALVYSTYLGGSSSDTGRGIAVDAGGNAYVAGDTGSTDFPVTPGAFDPTPSPSDGFATKLNATGSALVFSTYLGGSNFDQGLGISVDTAGNAYVTGRTDSSDFPTTPLAFDPTYNGFGDAFVTKLTSIGSVLYSTYVGGSLFDTGLGIGNDPTGNAYVTGYTASTDFPTTALAFDPTHNGNPDVFVTKLNVAGSAPLLYSTYVGGGATDIGVGIAVDGAGAAYVIGRSDSTNFPTTPAAFDPTYNGGNDAVVMKLNPAGSAPLLYSTYLGGTSHDEGRAIVIDPSGNAYGTGETFSANFPTTPLAVDPTYNGGGDAFVTELNAAGSAPLLHSTFLGGSGHEYGYGIALDPGGDVYVAGWTSSSDFPTTSGAYDTTFNGGQYDAFVTKLDMAPAGPCTGQVSGFMCRPPAGPCDAPEFCDGSNDSCPADAKRTDECRPSAGDCDVAESCDGANDACPTDTFEPNTSECRASGGVCDPAESCTGSTAMCPADAKSTAECRASAGDCDPAEACTGTGADCPADAKSAAVCRAPAGECDVAESCNGIANDCPGDAFRADTFECRASAGDCDVAESCPGTGASCPPDAFEPPSAVCRSENPARGGCDVAESCPGGGPTCPPDEFDADGTNCDDGLFCTGPDQTDECLGGFCVGEPNDCDDENACSADACNEDADTCEHGGIVPPCDGKMTGGGQIQTDPQDKRTKRTFGFNAKGVALLPGGASGHFNYVIHSTGGKINGPVTFIYYALPDANGGEMRFEVTTALGCKYNVTVEDQAEPGHRPPYDYLTVEPVLVLGTCPNENTLGARPLSAGNIQWHDQ